MQRSMQQRSFMKLRSLFFSSFIIFGMSYCQNPPRKADHPIEKVFLERQSRYAFERKLSPDLMKQKLMSLFEAARWAPSEYNSQPWRFIYGVHATPAWTPLFNLIKPGNQRWAEHAGALIIVLSRKTSDYNKKPLETHSLDTGMAVAHILLQATHLGLSAHPIGGFDKEKARKEFKIPQEYQIEMMLIVGEPSSKKDHPLAERDAKVSMRKPVSELAKEGSMPS